MHTNPLKYLPVEPLPATFEELVLTLVVELDEDEPK